MTMDKFIYRGFYLLLIALLLGTWWVFARGSKMTISDKRALHSLRTQQLYAHMRINFHQISPPSTIYENAVELQD